MPKDEKVIYRGKISKTVSAVKPVKNIRIHSFLEIHPVLREVLPSHKLQDHVYE